MLDELLRGTKSVVSNPARDTEVVTEANAMYTEAESAIRSGRIADAYAALHSFRSEAYRHGDSYRTKVPELEELAREHVVQPFLDRAESYDGHDGELRENYKRVAEAVSKLLGV